MTLENYDWQTQNVYAQGAWSPGAFAAGAFAKNVFQHRDIGGGTMGITVASPTIGVSTLTQN